MYARILVPVDDSPVSRQGFDEALRLARCLGSTLHLLNIVDVRRLFAEVEPRDAPKQLLEEWRTAGSALVEQLAAQARAGGVGADAIVRCDPGARVFETILQAATECGAGLIVMGTHGRSGLTRLALGSDAECVLRASPVPVLLVRAGAAVSERV